MKILAIETSCDETAAAVVEAPLRARLRGVKVLSNIVASSEEMHKKTGGIVPEVASREQVKAIIPVIEMTMRKSVKVSKHNIDAIAVTVGPGLIGSLLVGVETARALAYAWEKPIVPVNHLIAHLYANFVGEIFNSQFSIFPPKADQPMAGNEFSNSNFQIPEFPAVGLVVSGGHTDLVLIAAEAAKSVKVSRHNSIKIRLLGTTRDDAAGECFDKGSRLLQLGYPGGPAIAAEAAKLKVKSEKLKIKLPRPLIQDNTYDFSFSGLKTALGREVAQVAKVEQVVQELAYELQEAIVEVLVERVMRAVEEFRPKSVLLGGGVAANFRLRQKLEFSISNFQFPINLYIPPPKLCTDNAVMIGAAAYYNFWPASWQEVRADPGLEIV